MHTASKAAQHVDNDSQSGSQAGNSDGTVPRRGGTVRRNGTGPSKIDVIVLALARGGGATGIVDTEDVAVAAHRLAPQTFCWRKYPDQIDLDMVRTTLRHAAERDNPRVTGSVRTGWSLTRTGSDWAVAHQDALATDIRDAPPPNASAVRRENVAERREAERLRAHPAFRKHAAGEELSDHDAASVFRIDEYTPHRERALKIERLRLAVAAHTDLVAFVDAARAAVDH